TSTPSPTPQKAMTLIPATPSATGTPTNQPTGNAVAPGKEPTLYLSMTPGGTNAISRVVAMPNPNPKVLKVFLDGDVDGLWLKLYTPAMVCVSEAELGASQAGWVSFPLPADFLAG